MNTILLSFIAGILLLNFIIKNIDFEEDLVVFWIIIHLILVLISGVIIFGLSYGLNFLFKIINISI